MRPTALIGAAALAAACVLVPTAGHAEPPPSPTTQTLAPGMRQALQRDLGLSGQQVDIRLAHESAAPAVERNLAARLGDRFGGAWYDAGAGRLAVAVIGADPAARRAVEQAGARAVTVRYGAVALNTAKRALDATGAGAGVHSWWVDPATDSVTIAGDPAAARAFAKAAGLPASQLTVRPESTAPAPLYDIRGGDQYVINGNTLCSVGFSVNNGGFVTAGHCGGTGSPTLGYNNVSQGNFAGSSFPTNDYAWVRTNGNWTPRPWVNNYAGGNANVAGSNEAPVGAGVCRSGRTTGWRCGTVQAKNVTVNYSGQLVYGLTSTTACAEGGDSGGAWLWGDQAQGVTSGGSGNCSSGGTTLFQPVNEILGAYGLQLTTSGGGGGTSRIVGYANKCVDVPNSNGVDGQFLWLWTCNGTGAQNWTFPGDGTIRNFGLCMDVAWGSTANGAVVQLANCNSTGAQQWVLTGAGDLVNPQANKCLDVSGWNSADGARLIIWDCHGGANQKWRRA
ncbi:ricin-type beta-trefoil lectin domain protein [Asanoa iriomotensis]|uniref:Ricin B lectin domain-containing protein n=1 Tax=Asanoa iriomotensis TaxID=234613 RepID=A0ABQ4BZ64_9ACTN|nr:ricin-type beta-trefoil lectin domain protein [Asanoa iriomotensis]GIF55800.1 hypothetical protein Air01nite_18950 [Asanoa iriomotensis]